MDYLISDIPYFQTPNDIFEMDLTNNQKMVYIYLCRCANNGKKAFPSMQTISDKCSIGKSTAKRSVYVLEEEGYITKQIRYKNGTNYSNVYKVDYGRVMVNLPSATVNLVGSTESRYKELPINKSLERNNISTSFENDGLDSFINDYCSERFGKQLRKSSSIVDLEVLQDMEREEIYEFLDDNVKTYDQCNLDYLATIQFRAM